MGVPSYGDNIQGHTHCKGQCLQLWRGTQEHTAQRERQIERERERGERAKEKEREREGKKKRDGCSQLWCKTSRDTPIKRDAPPAVTQTQEHTAQRRDEKERERERERERKRKKEKTRKGVPSYDSASKDTPKGKSATSYDDASRHALEKETIAAKQHGNTQWFVKKPSHWSIGPTWWRPNVFSRFYEPSFVS